MTLRKVHMYIQRLLEMSGRSALLIACDESFLWDATPHLLARLIDELSSAVWLWTSANTDEDVPQPELIPRPGMKEPEEAPKEFASTQEIAAVFNSIAGGSF